MKSQNVTESIVRTATIGVKEADTSVQSVWMDLLSPMSKKRAKNLGMTEEDERKYVSRIARSIEGSGNFDKVVLGAFLDPRAHGHRHVQIYRGYSCRNF